MIAGLKERVLVGIAMTTDPISNNEISRYGENFSGGIFHFQDGEPANYVPMAGDLVMYSADDRNMHCVDEITDGERLTLTIWFSRNSSYDEDVKLISLVDRSVSSNEPAPCIPLPGSSNMYWFSSEQGSDQLQGFDIRYARLVSLGYDISCYEMNSATDISDVFSEPLRLAKGDTLFNKRFANLLHAMQAVQFYYWNRTNLLQSEGVRNAGNITQLSEAQKQDVCNLRSSLSRSMKLDASIFCYSSSRTIGYTHFDEESFSTSLTSWEEYTSKLHEQLIVHLPFWKEYKSLFSVSV
ncbi:hypothetical protein KSS87_010550 [Heliosperma pusillum]|nr:hypothetical protein KSS87_010550 [Heliosperma pusillum]